MNLSVMGTSTWARGQLSLAEAGFCFPLTAMSSVGGRKAGSGMCSASSLPCEHVACTRQHAPWPISLHALVFARMIHHSNNNTCN